MTRRFSQLITPNLSRRESADESPAASPSLSPRAALEAAAARNGDSSHAPAPSTGAPARHRSEVSATTDASSMRTVSGVSHTSTEVDQGGDGEESDYEDEKYSPRIRSVAQFHSERVLAAERQAEQLPSFYDSFLTMHKKAKATGDETDLKKLLLRAVTMDTDTRRGVLRLLFVDDEEHFRQTQPAPNALPAHLVKRDQLVQKHTELYDLQLVVI